MAELKAALAPVVEIWLDDPTGMRIEFLDYSMSYEYSLIANEPSPFRILLPSKFDRSLIKVDNIIEIWRGHQASALQLDYCGFLRDYIFGDQDGVPYTVISGKSSSELLERRIAIDQSGLVQTELTDHADDMIKAIFVDQLGADGLAARNLTAVAGGVTVQADNALCASITREFVYKNVLEVMQEIAGASQTAGKKLYFDLVPICSGITTGMMGFQMQTFVGQRGNNRGSTSGNPVIVGQQWDNMQNGSLEYLFSKEINSVVVLGPGSGAAQNTRTRTDPTRIAASIWNLREGVKSASTATPGSTAELDAEGDAYLNENKPKLHFAGEIVETPTFRYSFDWFFGDKVIAEYAGITMDANIDKVYISKAGINNETISAILEFDA